MKIVFRFAAMAAIVALAACATAPQVEYADNASFAQYHTFYWKPVKHKQTIKNPILDSQILDQRVRAAAVQALTNAGFQQVDNKKQADFIVTYQTATEQHLRSGDGFRFGFGVGYPFYYGPFWDPFFGAAYYPGARDVQSYQQGYLIIDVIDAHSNKLVWRGWTTARVTPGNYSRSAVKDMVKHILKRFPPS
jgi:hypothetical protein